MPGVEIKAAIATLLAAYFGDMGTGQLKHIDTQYPRASEQIGPSDFPRLIIWDRGHQEHRSAGGRTSTPIGMKALDWPVVLHVHTLLDNPLADGGAWDQLLDDIEAFLRTKAGDSSHQIFDGLADTTTSKVINADRIDRNTLQPDLGQMQNAYNSFITVTVEEIINA